MKRTLQILIAIIILITITSMMIFNQSRFGQTPNGERLERIKKSANYIDGKFKNLSETPVLVSEKSKLQIMSDFMFRKKIRVSPEEELPVIKTNIKTLNPKEDVLIWFGHSSYFIQLKGKKFLIDPVFSDYASPFSFINKAFKGTSLYKSSDFDDIDYLIITHDHWDHLDYNTIIDLKPKIRHIVCGLGIGQHFEYWGFDNSIITELDWYEGKSIGEGWQLTATPARHYSGRGLKGNQTLWVSFALQTPVCNIFLGGDSGYDTFFAEIGNKYGPFDIAILEQGQYDENWNLIHLMPGQLMKTAEQLKAHSILPVHNSRFALANHEWDEPLNSATDNHSDSGISVLTPQIGEVIVLKDTTHSFSKWWEEIN